MTTSLHFVVRGTPVSFQSRTEALREWKHKVATVAREHVTSPPLEDELAVSITHFYWSMPRYDTDNMSKAICDALSNIVYRDDWQIAERVAKRVSLDRAFILVGLPRDLVLALSEGYEFVFIRIKSIEPRSRPELMECFARWWPS